MKQINFYEEEIKTIVTEAVRKIVSETMGLHQQLIKLFKNN